MYKRASGILLMMNCLFILAFFCMKGLNILQSDSNDTTVKIAAFYANSALGIMNTTASGQRIVDFDVLQKNSTLILEEQDMEALLHIVEAEAGGEDEEGKLLVANVVLNRVKDDHFPDSISEVIYQKNNGVTQFSPVSNGKIDQVIVSDDTVKAVERALEGEDISQGALYFAARKYADSKKMKWFDENLTKLFQHGGHEFFK